MNSATPEPVPDPASPSVSLSDVRRSEAAAPSRTEPTEPRADDSDLPGLRRDKPVQRFGRYHLLRRVSIGGTSEIFKAKALGPMGFEKIVAIKRLLPQAEEDPELLAAFIAEMKLVALLDHPLIARIYEVGQVAHSDGTGGTNYLAMEYVYGVDLQELQRALAERGQVADPRLCCAIGIQAAHALDYAHHLVVDGRPLAIVHRDVSPQNLMMSATGELKLIDFGIAKHAGSEGRTKTGVVKGKHAYMSPEQVRRRPLTARSDIFSLGVILWELACGQRLFKRDTVLETLEAVEAAVVVWPDKKLPRPGELMAWINRCLERQPEDRPERAGILAAGLEAVLRELDPGGWDPREANPGIAQAMSIVAEAYATLFGDAGMREDDLTLDEYWQALRAAELGEDAQLMRRNPSDITIVPDTSDLAEYVARLRAHLPAADAAEQPSSPEPSIVVDGQPGSAGPSVFTDGQPGSAGPSVLTGEHGSAGPTEIAGEPSGPAGPPKDP